MKVKTALWVSGLIGACDAITGIMLLFSPVFTLRLMGVAIPPVDIVYLRYIGVFVFGVGASYFPPIVCDSARKSSESILTAWRITTLIRFCVGTFVLFQLIQHTLEPAWISVAITDLSIGVFQIFLLKKGIDADSC